MGVLCFGEVKHKSLTNTLQTIMWEEEMVRGKVFILKVGIRGLGQVVFTKSWDKSLGQGVYIKGRKRGLGLGVYNRDRG